MMMICITGTPGVGKTSVAKILSEIAGLKYYSLNDWKTWLKAGFDEKRGSVIIDEEKLAEIKVNGIVDGHLSHYCDCDAVIVLRCSNQKEHIKRMEKKGWSREKIRENMEAEIMEVVAEEARGICSERNARLIEIDTTGKSPEEVAAEILNNLSLPEKK